MTGLLVSMTSIGSGSILLCVLALYYPLSATTIVGTDLVHALVVSSVATVGHSMAGRVDVVLGRNGARSGAVPGVLIGARMATAVPERALRAALARRADRDRPADGHIRNSVGARRTGRPRR